MFGLVRREELKSLDRQLENMQNRLMAHAAYVRGELADIAAATFPSDARTRLSLELRYVASDMDSEEVVKLVRDQISQKRMR